MRLIFDQTRSRGAARSEALGPLHGAAHSVHLTGAGPPSSNIVVETLLPRCLTDGKPSQSWSRFTTLGLQPAMIPSIRYQSRRGHAKLESTEQSDPRGCYLPNQSPAGL